MSTDGRFDGPGPDKIFAEQIATGHFKLQRCNACSDVRFPPALVCKKCGSPDLLWIEASGNGTVYSTTVIRAREGSYNISLVDLEEGARMMSCVEGCAPHDVEIGMKVHSEISKDPHPHVIFKPIVERTQ